MGAFFYWKKVVKITRQGSVCASVYEKMWGLLKSSYNAISCNAKQYCIFLSLVTARDRGEPGESSLHGVTTITYCKTCNVCFACKAWMEQITHELTSYKKLCCFQTDTKTITVLKTNYSACFVLEFFLFCKEHFSECWKMQVFFFS